MTGRAWPTCSSATRSPLRQIRWHQQYLAAFPSRGSSANNHVIAEAAGQLVVSCAFPWFRESERWRRKSALPAGTGAHPQYLPVRYRPRARLGLSVLHRRTRVRRSRRSRGERSSAAARLPGHRLCALADSAAALVDERLRPPRQGDSDEGRGLLLDAPAPNRWPSMLALAEALVGRQDWWPRPPANAASSIVGALAGSRRQIGGRPSQRPSRFADAGITLLRTSGKNEIWCRCDGGPHGTAASLRMPTRMPCPSKCVTRASTSWPTQAPSATTASAHGAHISGRRSRTTPPNSVAGASRGEGGPFMWVRHAHAREIEVLDDGDIARWTAEHDGYASLDPPALHRRSVLLDRASRSIDIIDQIDGGSHDIRLAFHLGPDVQAELEESLRGPGLAHRIHTRRGAAGTAAGAAVEPAPGRDRSRPRLVLPWPGSARSRYYASGLRSLRAGDAPDHSAGVP